MDFIELYSRIFAEDKADGVYRQEALTFTDKIEKLFSDKSKLAKSIVPGKSLEKLSIAIPVKNIDKRYQDLILDFIAVDEERITRYGRLVVNSSKVTGNVIGKKVIELYVHLPHEVYSSLTQKKYNEYFLKNAKSIFLEPQMKNALWHEFIHLLDTDRIGSNSKDVLAKSSASTASKHSYYNDPMEFNAYVQQGLTGIEYHLSKLKSSKERAKLIGNNVNEFYNSVLKVLTPNFKKFLNDKYKAKLKKRVAQMWIDINKKAGDNKND